MAYLEFEPEDYLDEVSDRHLIAEMKRRGLPEPEKIDTIVDMLRDAWRDSDDVLFERALREIVKPGAEAIRAKKVRELYERTMAAQSAAA